MPVFHALKLRNVDMSVNTYEDLFGRQLRELINICFALEVCVIFKDGILE